MPRKPVNEKGSRPIKNKSGINTTQHKTELKDIKPIEPVAEDDYKCCTCGKKYKKQSGNFSFSQSPLYKGNNSFLPICNSCLENLVEQYTELLGSQNEAIKRVCLHWDIYLSESLLNSTKKIDANRSRIKCYIKNCNLHPNCGKTFDTYLREIKDDTIDSYEELERINAEAELNDEKSVSDRTVKRWGLGYSETEYEMLNDHYKVLKDKIGDDDVKDSLIKDLCEQHILKYRARQDKDYDRYEKMSKLYQQTLSTVDLKPKNSDKNAVSNNPDEVWGVFQKMVENYSPAEFFKDKTLFVDFNHQDEYYRRHIGRPTNNLVDGTTVMDSEYSVQVTDDD